MFGGALDFALGRHNKVWLGGEYVREEHSNDIHEYLGADMMYTF